MAFDEKLADRVRSVLKAEPGLTEKRMFGGLAFLVDTSMAVVVRGKGGLMIRVAPAETQSLLGRPGVAPAEMRGSQMRGWVLVGEVGYDKAADLRAWVKRGLKAARAAKKG